jgi:hypothetical protein
LRELGEDYVPEDDGYLDDILESGEGGWNEMDLRGELVSSLVKE